VEGLGRDCFLSSSGMGRPDDSRSLASSAPDEDRPGVADIQAPRSVTVDASAFTMAGLLLADGLQSPGSVEVEASTIRGCGFSSGAEVLGTSTCTPHSAVSFGGNGMKRDSGESPGSSIGSLVLLNCRSRGGGGGRSVAAKHSETWWPVPLLICRSRLSGACEGCGCRSAPISLLVLVNFKPGATCDLDLVCGMSDASDLFKSPFDLALLGESSPGSLRTSDSSTLESPVCARDRPLPNAMRKASAA